MASTARADTAPAKINLTLRVLGRRADGYHDLESLVAFAGVADRFDASPRRRLDAHGQRADRAGGRRPSPTISCSRRRARSPSAIAGLRLGGFALTKRLPVAAGLGGGSSDAAAALRLCRARERPRARRSRGCMAAARATGADVPVCLDPKPRVMRGIGEVLSAPVALPPLFGGAGRTGLSARDQGRVCGG